MTLGKPIEDRVRRLFGMPVGTPKRAEMLVEAAAMELRDALEIIKDMKADIQQGRLV